MTRIDADGSSNIDTDAAVSGGTDIIPTRDTDIIPSRDALAPHDDTITVEESDVTTRPAEWMTRPPSNAKAYDYRLQGVDLGVQLVADAGRPAPVKHSANRRARRRLMIQCVLVLVVTALVLVALRMFVIEPVTINSNAMVPNLPSGTSVLVVKWSALTRSTSRGDILVFSEPSTSHCDAAGSDSRQLIAHVIGMPGQTIWSRNGRVFVDGRVLNESGWYNPPFGEVAQRAIPRTTVPTGDYYMLGDNRTDMCDSRAFGPVAKSLIVGKVVGTVLRDGHPFVHGV